MGHRIRTEILGNKRAAYGEEIVSTLSAQLVVEFGRGFGKRNLFRMVRVAEVFPDREIVAMLSRQLGWSHFVELVRLDDPLKREFYAEMCRVERWSVRTLRSKVQGMRFERTALSKKPETLVRQELAKLREEDRLSPDRHQELPLPPGCRDRVPLRRVRDRRREQRRQDSTAQSAAARS